MVNPNMFQTPNSTAAPSDVTDVIAKPEVKAQPGRIGLWALGLGFGGFLLWAALAPLDQGVPGHGMVTIDTKSNSAIEEPASDTMRSSSIWRLRGA